MAPKRVAPQGLVPRARLHEGVLALNRALAPRHGARPAHCFILRGLASRWARAVTEGEVEVALSSLDHDATAGFATLAGPLEPLLPLGREAPPTGELCARVVLPAPRASRELAAYLGAAHEALLAAGAERRRAGAHHTDPELARAVVRRALEPLLARSGPSAPRVCDPAMGSGVFLAEVAEILTERSELSLAEVVARCLYGVDVDPLAVALGAVSLFVLSGRAPEVATGLRSHLRVTDFTLDEAGEHDSSLDEVQSAGGFDAVVGNPPWVAFAGRAAQPLDPARRRFYAGRFAAFAGYRTLHGVFVERAAEALRPGGRLGLVLPTSVADLDGYAPVRRAHDALCEPERALPDYGADAFEGVFQPSMALVSTRRAAAVVAAGEAWDLERGSDDLLTELLEAAARGPRVPEACFGERGFQSSKEDRSLLARQPDSRRTLGLRCGADVGPFVRHPPSYWVAPSDLGSRLRSASQWEEVAVYVRQTARFPMACLSDGAPFRNSILAGFGVDDRLTPEFLVAYLNASLVRYLHYARFRDARQGMPQVKISHLRRTPLPPSASAAFFHELALLGAELSRDNTGASSAAQARLDRAVVEAWGVSSALAARAAEWALGEGRVPVARAWGRRPPSDA